MVQTDEIYRDLQICACLPQYEIKKAGGKDCSNDASSGISFTWDPKPRSSHQHPNVVVLGSYKLRQKTSFGKSRRHSCLSVATPSSLPFRPFLVSRGGLTCCHAGLLGHRPCAAPRLASSLHNDGTKPVTCKLGKTQAFRPVAPVSL